jgi:putative sensory transduction regulator
MQVIKELVSFKLIFGKVKMGLPTKRICGPIGSNSICWRSILEAAMRVIITALACLFIIASGPSFAQGQQGILSTITAEQLASVLTDRQATVEQSGSTKFVKYNLGEPWSPEAGLQAIAIPEFCDQGGCAGIQLFFVIQLPGAKLPIINKINGELTFGRAFLSEDGSVGVSNYVLLNGGVTANNILSYVAVFDQIAAKVYIDLGGE